MSTGRHGPRSWVFGQEPTITGRFAIVVAVAYLVLLLLRPSPRSPGIGELLIFFGIAGIAVGICAAHAYLNRGLLTGVGLAYVFLVGAVGSGLAPIYFTTPGWNSNVNLLLVDTLQYALIFGAVGGGLGVAARRLTR